MSLSAICSTHYEHHKYTNQQLEQCLKAAVVAQLEQRVIVNQQLEIVPFKPGAIPNLVSSSIKDHAGLQGDSECTMRVENSCTVSPMKVEVVWLDCCCFCGLFACLFVCLWTIFVTYCA